MNVRESCLIYELEEMNDELTNENVELKEENDTLKDLLIDALLDLREYQRENIEILVNIIDDLEEPFDDNDICDCAMCH